MLHYYFLIEYLVMQLEQLSTQQLTPTQDETDYNESMEEGMESEDEEEAIEEGYEEHNVGSNGIVTTKCNNPK